MQLKLFGIALVSGAVAQTMPSPTFNNLTVTGTATIPFTQSGANTVAYTVDGKLKDGEVTIKDFGGVCDGAANDRTFLSNATTRTAFKIKTGTCRVGTSNLTISANVDFEDGQICPDAGITVTFTGNVTAPPTKKIFCEGAGSVSLLGQKTPVKIEWWGGSSGVNVAVPSAAQDTYMQKAHDALAYGGVIEFNEGGYGWSGTATALTITNPVSISCPAWNYPKDGFVPIGSSSSGVLFDVAAQYTFVKGCMGWSAGISSGTLPNASTFLRFSSGSGINDIADLTTYNYAVGIKGVSNNGSWVRTVRFQVCDLCIDLGGTAANYFGDTHWSFINLIPTATGTGWRFRGGANAQYRSHVLIVGGAYGDDIGFSGTETVAGWTRPLNIWCQMQCNISKQTTNAVKITAAWSVQYDISNLNGTSGGSCVSINGANASDIDGVSFGANTAIGGCAYHGIDFAKGRNVAIQGAKLFANSCGTANTYSGVNIGAGAQGVFMMTGSLNGVSSGSDSGWGNNRCYQKYAVDINASALTDDAGGGANPLGYGTVVPAVGRILIHGNMLGGNTSGAINGTGAPAGGKSVLTPNLTN